MTGAMGTPTTSTWAESGALVTASLTVPETVKDGAGSRAKSWTVVVSSKTSTPVAVSVR